MADQTTPNYRIARTPRRASAMGGNIVHGASVGDLVVAPLTADGGLMVDRDGEVLVTPTGGSRPAIPYYVAPDSLEPIAPGVTDEQLAKGFVAIGLAEVTVEKIAAARKVAEIVVEVTA